MGNEIEIVVIGVRTWTKKDNGQKYYVVDYYRTETYRPKTDFIDVLEYNAIAKKLDNKHGVKCVGIRKADKYDRLYVSDIKL